MAKALITGALGQDGGILCDRLGSDGWEVFGIVRPERAGESAACRLLGVDLTDPLAVDAVIEQIKPDAVFHVAAAHHAADASPAADAALWRMMTAVNHGLTTWLMQSLRRHAPQARLVYAASSQMYRTSGADLQVNEQTPYHPSTYYGLTKTWSMSALCFAREQLGLHASGAVLFNHESTRRPEAFVTRKISRTAAAIKLGLADRLELRNIGARADWFSAEDAAEAMVRMAQAATPDDYVIGSGRASSVTDLLLSAFGALDLDWRDYVRPLANTPGPTLIADPMRIGRALEWAPRQSIEEVMGRMTAFDLADLTAAKA